ncbi:MAG: 2-phosphosulfolactate phosphatase [Halanaerobium sp.]|nr:2-phosphosulfolactate phosphatase [Halanaerobium sp.]
MPRIKLVSVCEQPVNFTQDDLVIVVDSLRATTTIVTAVAEGCREIRPVQNPRAAFRLKSRLVRETRYPGGSILLGGEKNGHSLPGFDLGNSPAEYVADKVRNKTIIMTTTNGTKALYRAGSAGKVYIGAWLNSRYLADNLLAVTSPVTFLCAGTRGDFSLEDFYTCGKIIASMEQMGARKRFELELDDGARAASLLYQSRRNSPEEIFATSTNGRRLQEIGESADIRFCLRTDRLDILPALRCNMVICDTRA